MWRIHRESVQAVEVLVAMLVVEGAERYGWPMRVTESHSGLLQKRAVVWGG